MWLYLQFKYCNKTNQRERSLGLFSSGTTWWRPVSKITLEWDSLWKFLFNPFFFFFLAKSVWVNVCSLQIYCAPLDKIWCGPADPHIIQRKDIWCYHIQTFWKEYLSEWLTSFTHCNMANTFVCNKTLFRNI